MSERTDDLERPPFRGCVFCYSAEMSLYGARKLRRWLRPVRDA